MKITLTKATAALWRQATLNPDRVNPTNGAGCEYLRGDDERCLIGQVIFDLTGFSMEGVPESEYNDGPTNFGDYIDAEATQEKLADAGIVFTESALRLLAEAQRTADGPLGYLNERQSPAWRDAVIEVMER